MCLRYPRSVSAEKCSRSAVRPQYLSMPRLVLRCACVSSKRRRVSTGLCMDNLQCSSMSNIVPTPFGLGLNFGNACSRDCREFSCLSITTSFWCRQKLLIKYYSDDSCPTNSWKASSQHILVQPSRHRILVQPSQELRRRRRTGKTYRNPSEVGGRRFRGAGVQDWACS